jgi:hypothetical protein
MAYPPETCRAGWNYVPGRCTNLGVAPWPDLLYVVPSDDPDAALGNSTTTAVRGACVDTRHFTVHYTTPFVVAAGTFDPQWRFVLSDGGALGSLPTFGATIRLDPSCDAGLDAARPPRVDAGRDVTRADESVASDSGLDERPHRASGCACRTTGGHGSASARFLASLLVACARRRRRSVPDRASSGGS